MQIFSIEIINVAGAVTARCTCNAANNISAVTDGLGNQTRKLRVQVDFEG